jgi:NADP-dependent aldehyde dehydrogenase
MKEVTREHFGPFAVVVLCQDEDDLYGLLWEQPGSLTGSLHTGPGEAVMIAALRRELSRFCGRAMHNGYPTGIPVGWATVHGSPYPATTASTSTLVGMTAARRFQRPVAAQPMPDAALPAELQDANPLGLMRLVNGRLSSSPIRRQVQL